MRFKKIVSVDYTGIEETEKARLYEISDECYFYDDIPCDNEEIVSRIGDADCVLVSWNTPIDKEVIEKCKHIKYIGMCCSLYDEKSANVDIKTAKGYGITVLGVKDYGDEGVIEFVFSELIRLLHGFGNHKWKEEVLELTNQKVGIIGLGATGKMFAEKAKSFGMDVYYYSRNRKYDLEENLVKYLELDELLKHVDILTTHLPKHTLVLDKEKLNMFGNGKILVNTSLEPTFHISSFSEWILNDNNYAIFDRVAMGKHYDLLKGFGNVIYSEKVSGWTKQAKARLSKKVLENIEGYII